MNNLHALSSNAYALPQRKRELDAPFGLKHFLNAIHPANWFARRQSITNLKGELADKEQEIAHLKWELLQRSEQLKNITYYQSHTVRRPLANILGITELIVADDAAQHGTEIAELVSLLRISADELDKAIKNNAQGV